MSSRYPRLWSSVFRKTFWAGLEGSPLQALAGLYWTITRRRVRGWSRLLAAAAESLRAYECWMAFGELAAYQRFWANHPTRRRTQIRPLIIAPNEVPTADILRTLESVRVAIAEDVPVYVTRDGVDGCEATPDPHSLALALGFSEGIESGWLMPLLAGDEIAPRTGEILERAFSEGHEPDLAYWDEDRIVDRVRQDPWIKPTWDPHLFSACFGLVGASVISMRTVRKGMAELPAKLDREALEQWLFALLRGQQEPRRIPLILTHRNRPRQIRPNVLPGRTDWPKISILIPTRDRSDLLSACLGGLAKLSYPGVVELVLIDNGTTEPAALRMMEELQSVGRARVLRVEGAFNFSRLNNIGAREATGDVLCLLNNDVEALDGEWLGLMVNHCLEPSVGAVGALLLYPDERVQHAGVVIGMGGAAGHVQKGVHVEDERFSTWHRVTREVSAVTAAVMVVRKQSFFDVGGFDEEAFPVAFNDVDLCLRLKKAGLRNIYVAESRLVHHESVSRGQDRSPEKARRFAAELSALQDRWGTLDFEDPHFSPLFSKAAERCTLLL